MDVIKSENDDREYKYLTLANKVRLLLISDPSSEKSAASASIYAGHTNDPPAVPGIAHFCEHMLFLGTEKYPDESEYTNFMVQHGGAPNACTGHDYTNYFFDVKSESLLEAIDRFAQFFISPLFNADATDRELNAIESEHSKNVLNDAWRKNYINACTAKEGHVYNKFGTGNLETLKTIPEKEGIDIRELLLDFHSKFYSANIMTVAVLGKEDVATMEKEIAPLFENVQNKDVTISLCEEFPFGDEELGIMIKIPPIKEMKKLDMLFQLPDLHEHYRCNPTRYISHLIGHEGPGSLLSLLKKKLWVNELYSGNYRILRGFEFFIVSMELTDDGLDNVTDVMTTCFQYIKMLKTNGPQERLYHEMKVLEEMRFRFKDKEHAISYVRNLSNDMHDYPAEDVLYGKYRLDSFQPELITKVLDYMNPKNFRCAVMAQIYEGKTDRVCKYYDAAYSVEKISPEQIQKWEDIAVHAELHLPNVNEFIPDSLEVVVPKTKTKKEEGVEEVKAVPTIVKDNNLIRVWYKPDDTFFLPKAVLKVAMSSPIAACTPASCNDLEMFTMLLHDAVVEYGYDAEIAGIRYNIQSLNDGFKIEVSGYNDKQLVLLKKILEHVVAFEVKPERFEVHKVQYEERLNNFDMDEPFKQVGSWHSMLMTEKSWTAEDQLQCIDQLTVESVRKFIPELLRSIYIECLCCGNLLQDDVNNITNTVEDILLQGRSIVPLFPRQHHMPRDYQLKRGGDYLFEKRSKIHANSCVRVHMEVGLHNIDNAKLLCELFGHISSAQFFDILRTKEQLGYIVGARVCVDSSTVSMVALVQSDKPMSSVQQKMEEFYTSFEETLVALTEEQFTDYVEGLAVQKLEKPKRLSVESWRFWSEIRNKQYHFKRSDVEVEALRKLTKDDVITFYRRFISPASQDRTRLAVVVLGKDAASLRDGVVVEGGSESKWNVIDDVLSFQSSHAMYQHIMPYNNIPLVSTAKYER